MGTLTLAALAVAQADPVKIVFLPPPMEGVLSVGVYDNAGTLVRVLQREAEWSEFTADDNGLTVQWDGKDDHGAVCPTGTYRVRGVAVGDVGVEGVGFIGNDWVTSDDSPRFSRIYDLGMSGSGMLVIETGVPQPPERSSLGPLTLFTVVLKPATNAGEEQETQLIPQAPSPDVLKSRTTIEKGKILGNPIPGLKKVADMARGKNGSLWVIAEGTVRQYSKEGKQLRALASEPDAPAPMKLTASTTEEKVYVLYQNAALQRLRGYDFTGVKPGGAPKVLFENDIVFSNRYEQVAAELKFQDGTPFTASPVLTGTLQPNPLAGNKPGTLLLRAAVDKDGAYLAAADGLPLCHISDTKAVVWAVLGRPANSKAITVFDSDGAVVEQFQVSKIANMMTFDAGTVQWTVPVPTPTPSPSATPTATPSATPAAAH